MIKSTYAGLVLGSLVLGLCNPGMSMDPPPQTSDQKSDPRSTESNHTIDFINDLIPMITKLGCNAGKCHGSAIGRGGFKLSLYGGSPKTDYDEIVRRHGGRRINLADPESSLIFIKPAEFIEHGGGAVIEDDQHSMLLLDWIEQGAKFIRQRELKHIEVHPARYVATKVGDTTSFKVLARYHDGSTRDVTNLTRFTADDSTAVRIDKGSATATLERTGRHIVIARYSTEVIPIELLVPTSQVAPDLSHETRKNFVDEEVLSSLSELRVPVSPILDDRAFMRRITLDLTGRLPAQSVETDQTAIDRETIIDDLLRSEAFVNFYTLKLARLLRIQSKQDKNLVTTTPQAARAFHDYLARQLRARVGYDQIAREILTATGDTSKYGPAAFFTAVEDPRLQTEFTTEVFMGSRMKCANCHNHPLDKWTQDDFHGLTAMFSKLTRSQVIRLNPIGKNIHPNTGEAALMKLPGGEFLPEDTRDGRSTFAAWLTDRDNPYFARAIVNRLWQSLMGRGLVEPLDDFRATNPPTHPALLDRLASDFIDHGYNIRHTLKRIAMSTTYSRSSNPIAGNETDGRFYSHRVATPLGPEVLADAISDVLGIPSRYGNEMPGTRAVDLKDGGVRSDALDILGRCDRSNSCEGAPSPIGPLAQKLHLFNGELLNNRIGAHSGRLDTLIKSQKLPIEIATEFYQVALNRHPNKNELKFFEHLFNPKESSARQRAVLEDFVWGLVTCREFTINH
ncbi:MAG: hypothetical protein CMM01_02820 [Rhodopirellula sp.]|nr:hypothetical protein [Rhodopirellula sp.]